MDKKGRPCLCTTAIQVPQNNTQCFIFVEKNRGTTDQVDVPNSSVNPGGLGTC